MSDPREGLARARNIGIQESSGKYILNFGSDNEIPTGELEKMLHYLITREYSGVSSMTYLKNADESYLTWAMDCYKRVRYYPGERPVIGTPTLFLRQLLIDFPYDNKMSWSDDSDLCDRLRKSGHTFAISDSFVYEVGSTSLKDIFYRWKGYGKSDWEIYRKYSSRWNMRRRLLSLTHPLRSELLFPLKRVKKTDFFAIIPYLIFITSIRYFYWVKFTIFGVEQKGI